MTNNNFPAPMTEVESYELPAGRYLIADPCFAVGDDDRWGDFLEEKDCGDDTFYFEGSEVFTVETGGDGSWDHEGETYYVEAGLFGAVPEELVDRKDAQGVWVDAPNGLEIDVIRDKYGSLRGIKVGEVEVVWYEFDDEAIAEFAFENDEYSVITTREQYDALVEYVGADYEEDLEAAKAALPQFA